MLRSATIALAALSAIASAANITTLKPSSLTPFLHMDLKVEDSTFVTTTNGVLTGQANNQGGKQHYITIDLLS